MFAKLRENEAFTLVELMVVVAIIGILAAVAIPYYQRYIQKSRLVSLVFPGVHTIECDLATYYAMQLNFPSASSFYSYTADADTQYFTPTLSVSGATVNFTINASGATSPLHDLDGQVLSAHPITSNGKIQGWALSGTLAQSLGLQGER